MLRKIVTIIMIATFSLSLLSIDNKTASTDVAGLSKHSMDSTIDSASSVHTADVDGDNHMDVLDVLGDKGDISWWRSQGVGSAMVAAGYSHIVGLRSDGTVVATGDNGYGQCDVGSWLDIQQVAAGYSHTVGVRLDGTVVATGRNNDGQCDVGGWTDIQQVAAGVYHTVGVRSDGTVVTIGSNGYGQCDVGVWTDIQQVAARQFQTVGVRLDGMVVATGLNNRGQCNVGGWKDVQQVAAGRYHTVGLRSDGTVVATGIVADGQCDVTGWMDIQQVAAGYYHTVGVRLDGTVVATGRNNDGQCDVGGWMDVQQVAAGRYHTVGLRSDGTVASVGPEVNLSDWNLLPQCTSVTWEFSHGLIQSPSAAFSRHYNGTTIALIEIPPEDMPEELIIVWFYDETAMAWKWFRVGWPESTLETLEYCHIYDVIVMDACTWEIPQS